MDAPFLLPHRTRAFLSSAGSFKGSRSSKPRWCTSRRREALLRFQNPQKFLTCCQTLRQHGDTARKRLELAACTSTSSVSSVANWATSWKHRLSGPTNWRNEGCNSTEQGPPRNARSARSGARLEKSARAERPTRALLKLRTGLKHAVRRRKLTGDRKCRALSQAVTTPRQRLGLKSGPSFGASDGRSTVGPRRKHPDLGSPCGRQGHEENCHELVGLENETTAFDQSHDCGTVPRERTHVHSNLFVHMRRFHACSLSCWISPFQALDSL